jgi:hypothetical protein
MAVPSQSAVQVRAHARVDSLVRPLALGRGEQLRRSAVGDRSAERSTARSVKRLGAFRALDTLSTFSSLQRVRKCRRVPVGQAAVQIVHRVEDGRAHFSGLQTCGSLWSCPLCSEKILAGRADELLTAINTWTGLGGDVIMGSLTMRHHRHQSLGDLWDALGEAWRAAYGSKIARKLLKSCHWVRRVESTHGCHGWHVHIHFLLFVPSGTEPTELGNCMFDAWSRRLVSLGMQAPLRDEGGLHIKRLDLSNAAAEVAEYLAKGHYEEVNNAPVAVEQPGRTAALELASISKQARGANRTPFQILAAFVANGEAADAELWREWENGSKGRRAITWSRGARDALVPDVEQTDEELACETDGDGIVVAELRLSDWPQLVKRPELLNTLLTLVEMSCDSDDAYLMVDAVLTVEGFPGVAMRPPDRMPQWAS